MNRPICQAGNGVARASQVRGLQPILSADLPVRHDISDRAASCRPTYGETFAARCNGNDDAPKSGGGHRRVLCKDQFCLIICPHPYFVSLVIVEAGNGLVPASNLAGVGKRPSFSTHFTVCHAIAGSAIHCSPGHPDCRDARCNENFDCTWLRGGGRRPLRNEIASQESSLHAYFVILPVRETANSLARSCCVGGQRPRSSAGLPVMHEITSSVAYCRPTYGETSVAPYNRNVDCR